MKKLELRKRYRELTINIRKDLDERLEKIINSGCVDIESAPSGQFGLAKDILTAALEDLACQYLPFQRSRSHKKEINNIKKFI